MRPSSRTTATAFAFPAALNPKRPPPLSDPFAAAPILPAMQFTAPSSETWRALAEAVVKVMAAAAGPGGLKVLLKAVRELKAQAIWLLFALAKKVSRGLCPPLPPLFTGRVGFGQPWRGSGWRNPPVIAYVASAEPVARAPRAAPEKTRQGSSPDRLAKALATLRAIQKLCADPSFYAERLALRLAARPVVITRAEVAASATLCRAQERRNRDAARRLRSEMRAVRARARRDSS